jgi:hypothetical protein
LSFGDSCFCCNSINEFCFVHFEVIFELIVRSHTHKYRRFLNPCNLLC